MTNLPSLSIAGIAVRQDAQGRFSLNDLHRAAGGEKRHQPSDWLRVKQTQELIAELATPGNPGVKQNQPVAVRPGAPDTGGGSYVVKELVYAYAMWISPAFCLLVIRTFDAVTQEHRRPVPLTPSPSTVAIDDPWTEPLRAILTARWNQTAPALRASLFVPGGDLLAAMGLSAADDTIAERMRLSRVVRSLGWRNVQVRRPGLRIKGYRPGPDLLNGAAVVPVASAPRQALPIAELPRDVRQAINRKAHALGAAAFDHNVEVLKDWLRRQPDLSDPDGAIERIHALDLDHGQHVMVNIQALWDITSMLGAVEALVASWRTRVEALESATGRRLYSRPVSVTAVH